MKCKKCGAEIPKGEIKCSACGWVSPVEKPVSLELTTEEARDGCVKSIHAPCLERPLRLRLKPGITNGKMLLVNNAKVLGENGAVMERPIRVRIVVKDDKTQEEKPQGESPKTDRPRRENPQRKKQKASSGKGFLIAGIVVALLCLGAAIWGVMSVIKALNPPDAGTTGGSSQTDGSGNNVEPGQPYSPVYEIPHLEQRYFLSNLSPKSRNVIFSMYDSLMAFEESCVLTESVTADELRDLLLILKYECPELMQVDPSAKVKFMQNANSGTVEKIQWDYLMTQQEYEQQVRACQSVVDALVASVNGMGDWEKEKIAFDFVANSCYYSMEAPNAGNAYGVFVDKKAKCDGISAAMKWILEDMGLPCFTLFGDSADGSVGHAWNVALINGKYYDLDVTADVRVEGKKRPILYQAFNTSDTWVRGQYTLDKAFSAFESIPGTADMSGSYYVEKGWYVESGKNADKMLAEQFYDAACDGREYFHVQFESKADMDAFVGNLDTFMKEQSAAQNVSNLRWECTTFEAYHVVYVKIIK